mmetsp:Transcript_123080/g.383170  ORF Transcript_123080/g.383170 Transcript_123080/m.383170 type:complete len:323 (-) Transcript_123080:105-1073(-)
MAPLPQSQTPLEEFLALHPQPRALPLGPFYGDVRLVAAAVEPKHLRIHGHPIEETLLLELARRCQLAVSGGLLGAPGPDPQDHLRGHPALAVLLSLLPPHGPMERGRHLRWQGLGGRVRAGQLAARPREDRPGGPPVRGEPQGPPPEDHRHAHWHGPRLAAGRRRQGPGRDRGLGGRPLGREDRGARGRRVGGHWPGAAQRQGVHARLALVRLAAHVHQVRAGHVGLGGAGPGVLLEEGRPLRLHCIAARRLPGRGPCGAARRGRLLQDLRGARFAHDPHPLGRPERLGMGGAPGSHGQELDRDHAPELAPVVGGEEAPLGG